MTMQIPGVTIEVYKQDRRLEVKEDGHVGQLWSGFAVILTVIDPGANSTIGVFRDGRDHYFAQKDWLNNPRTESQQHCHRLYLTSRNFPIGAKVYGVKIPLRVDEERAINTVHYPENMLILAQFAAASVVIWKVALVSQDGDFFLTVQQAYDTTVHVNQKSKVVLPRFRAHKQLECLLANHFTIEDNLSPESDFVSPSVPSADGLSANQGIVERWYDARNMGCVITPSGPARVHWRDAPKRPRRRFLLEGERVQFDELVQPPRNPKTDWRKMRKARFQWQACGVRRV